MCTSGNSSFVFFELVRQLSSMKSLTLWPSGKSALKVEASLQAQPALLSRQAERKSAGEFLFLFYFKAASSWVWADIF